MHEDPQDMYLLMIFRFCSHCILPVLCVESDGNAGRNIQSAAKHLSQWEDKSLNTTSLTNMQTQVTIPLGEGMP